MAQVIRNQGPGFNNVQTQHADIELRLPGGIFDQITKITYSAKVAREEARGTSILGQGFTRGALTFEASMAINRAFRQEFVNALSRPPKGFFEGFFPIIVTLNHPDWDRVETDTLYCAVAEFNFDSSSGPAVHTLDVPLTCAYIQFKSGGKILPMYQNIISG